MVIQPPSRAILRVPVRETENSAKFRLSGRQPSGPQPPHMSHRKICPTKTLVLWRVALIMVHTTHRGPPSQSLLSECCCYDGSWFGVADATTTATTMPQEVTPQASTSLGVATRELHHSPLLCRKGPRAKVLCDHHEHCDVSGRVVASELNCRWRYSWCRRELFSVVC